MVAGVLVLVVPVRDASFWVGSGWKVTSLFQSLVCHKACRCAITASGNGFDSEIESTMIAVTIGITVGFFLGVHFGNQEECGHVLVLIFLH